MEIVSMTNADPKFYARLGPFLARREVEKEIGYKIYDDDDKVWFIALEGERVLGFCYLARKTEAHYQIGSCYVVEAARREGIFRQLFTEATRNIKGAVSLTTRNQALIGMLEREGFSRLGMKGSFVRFAKEF